MIYAMSDGQLIKIGWTQTPERRLRQLQTGSAQPLKLVWLSPGTKAEEQALHKHFKAYRVRGEWFLPVVLDHLAADYLIDTCLPGLEF